MRRKPRSPPSRDSRERPSVTSLSHDTSANFIFPPTRAHRSRGLLVVVTLIQTTARDKTQKTFAPCVLPVCLRLFPSVPPRLSRNIDPVSCAWRKTVCLLNPDSTPES